VTVLCGSEFVPLLRGYGFSDFRWKAGDRRSPNLRIAISAIGNMLAATMK